MRPTRRLTGLLIAGCASLLAAAPGVRRAAATDIKGSVSVRAPNGAAEARPARPAYVHEWNGFLQPKEAPRSLSADVAVVLIGAQGGAQTEPLTFQQGALTHATVVVQAGSALRIQNNDDFAHELHAVGNDRFPPLETIAGSGRQVQLDKPGSWPLRDRVASHVRGHLHVLPKVTAVAYPNAKGEYVFEDIPAGSYTLKVFLGAQELSNASLQVPEARELRIDPMTLTIKATTP